MLFRSSFEKQTLVTTLKTDPEINVGPGKQMQPATPNITAISQTRHPSLFIKPTDPQTGNTDQTLPDSKQGISYADMQTVPNPALDNQSDQHATQASPASAPSMADTGQAYTHKQPDSLEVPVPEKKEKTPDSHRKSSQWIPSIGVYYTPEWMFNTLEGSKFINNFGLEGIFYFGRFSVRTGAGLSVGTGTHELVVEYNDFLGAYNKLDSMNFTWSDPIKNYIPKMYISQKDVWDSLMKLDYAKVVKRYTYLQVQIGKAHV